MSKSQNRFEGIFPAAITPFDENEDIDESKLTEFLDFLIDRGVHGIYLLGTNGEAPLLDIEEKKKVIDISIEHVNGKVPIVAGTMCNSTKKTIEVASWAEKKGADAVHIVIPYYFPSPHKVVLNHFERISKEIDLPIFVYSIPQRTGNELTMRTLKALSDIDNVVALKDSSGDIEFFYRCLHEIDELCLFGGNDSLINTYLTLGGDGSVTAVGNAFPELVSSIYDQHIEGKIEDVSLAQDKVLKIKNMLRKGPYLSGIKAALKVRGYDFGEVRKPLKPYSDYQMKELKKSLDDLGLLR